MVTILRKHCYHSSCSQKNTATWSQSSQKTATMIEALKIVQPRCGSWESLSQLTAETHIPTHTCVYCLLLIVRHHIQMVPKSLQLQWRGKTRGWTRTQPSSMDPLRDTTTVAVFAAHKFWLRVLKPYTSKFKSLVCLIFVLKGTVPCACSTFIMLKGIFVSHVLCFTTLY